MILRLLGAKGNVVSRRCAGKWALLCTLARRWDHDDLFRRMVLHNRVDVNVVDKLGNSPLHNAVLNGRLDKVEALLSRKDILLNSANLRGRTPIAHAIRLEDWGVVRALLACPKVEINRDIFTLLEEVERKHSYTLMQRVASLCMTSKAIAEEATRQDVIAILVARQG